MAKYYITTIEIVTDCEDLDSVGQTVFDKEFDIEGIIKITEERQKKRPSFKVYEGTLKKHVRDLYDEVTKPQLDEYW